jgi:hypothetical protein
VSASSRAEPFVRASGVVLILFSVLARVFTSPSRIPYWDIDPLTSWTPDTTRTPAMSLLFDALVWFAAVLILWAEGRAGRPLPWKSGALALFGCIGVVLHGWMLTPIVAVGGVPPIHGDFHSMTLGSAWASAMIGAWALAMAAREPAVKRAVAATLLGATILLAGKGALQVFIEHPRLVAEFNADKARMLAAQGFQPGSTVARLFERRLLQPEATGWFGLANVYGTFLAAATAAFLALALGGTRAARARAITSGEAGFMWLLGAVAALGLALSQSKGAIAAAVLGCVLVVALRWIESRREPSAESARRGPLRAALRFAPLLLPLLALGAVAARGLFGERPSELSIYFRWQYLLAAGRIIAANAPFGVGPAGFKDQYLLHKEPTNPEEIESPHCLPADWLATLGVFGVAWVILWGIRLWKGGLEDSPRSRSGLGMERRTGDAPRSRSGLVILPLSLFAALAFSWWCEWAALTPEILVVIAGAALLVWLGGRLILRASEADHGALNHALFAAAAVLATHCMIEVTGVFASSAGWVMGMVAIAAARAAPARDGGGRRLSVVGMALCALGTGVLARESARAWGVERMLWEAADEARSATPHGGRPMEPAALDRAILALDASESIAIRDVLRRLNFARALERASRGAPRDLESIHADALLSLHVSTPPTMPGSSAEWARIARTIEITSGALDRPADRADAQESWRRAAELDPHGLTPTLHVARLYAEIGRCAAAARWAARAIEINQNLRLDPLKQLTDAERAEMERLAFSSEATPIPQDPTPVIPSPP